jgi:hypothetical protein
LYEKKRERSTGIGAADLDQIRQTREARIGTARNSVNAQREAAMARAKVVLVVETLEEDAVKANYGFKKKNECGNFVLISEVDALVTAAANALRVLGLPELPNATNVDNSFPYSVLRVMGLPPDVVDKVPVVKMLLRIFGTSAL